MALSLTHEDTRHVEAAEIALGRVILKLFSYGMYNYIKLVFTCFDNIGNIYAELHKHIIRFRYLLIIKIYRGNGVYSVKYQFCFVLKLICGKMLCKFPVLFDYPAAFL